MSSPAADDLAFRSALQLDPSLSQAPASESSPRPRLTRTGKVLLAGAGASFVAITALTAPFLLPALRRICLPYVPATPSQVENVMSLLRGRAGSIVDLGSGDGRIVIEAARRGLHAEGVELNPWLVAYSRYRSLREGVSSRTRFVRRNLWKHDLSSYNAVVIFGVDSMMEPLRTKLARELSAQGCVIACRFPMEGRRASAEVGTGLDTVWLYSKRDLLEAAGGAEGGKERKEGEVL